MIDVDAIPLDVPAPRRPVAVLYQATVEALPDGREIVVPRYGEAAWQWFAKRTPTPARGSQGGGA